MLVGLSATDPPETHGTTCVPASLVLRPLLPPQEKVSSTCSAHSTEPAVSGCSAAPDTPLVWW